MDRSASSRRSCRSPAMHDHHKALEPPGRTPRALPVARRAGSRTAARTPVGGITRAVVVREVLEAHLYRGCAAPGDIEREGAGRRRRLGVDRQDDRRRRARARSIRADHVLADHDGDAPASGGVDELRPGRAVAAIERMGLGGPHGDAGVIVVHEGHEDLERLRGVLAGEGAHVMDDGLRWATARVAGGALGPRGGRRCSPLVRLAVRGVWSLHRQAPRERSMPCAWRLP